MSLFLKTARYFEGSLGLLSFPTLLSTLLFSGDSLAKRITAIAAKNATLLSIQKDHLQEPKKVEIAGERIKPTIPPILELATKKLVATSLLLD
jgi:hypothetical protein